VLDHLKSHRLLEPLVFGGGTMLRLCHELNRYSVDLDFWFIKQLKYTQYFEKMKTVLTVRYQVTDSWQKHFSLLFELRSKRYPRRLKIEIRKGLKDWDFQESIAFSPHASKQVLLRTHTLCQTMKNKVAALLDRKEIRDAFDMEFLLRKGVPLPSLSQSKTKQILEIINAFSAKTYKVTLGSLLEKAIRDHYIKNKFEFLRTKLI